MKPCFTNRSLVEGERVYSAHNLEKIIARVLSVAADGQSQYSLDSNLNLRAE